MRLLVFDNKEIINNEGGHPKYLPYQRIDHIIDKSQKYPKHTILMNIINNTNKLVEELKMVLNQENQMPARLISKIKCIKDKDEIKDRADFVIDLLVNELKEVQLRFKKKKDTEYSDFDHEQAQELIISNQLETLRIFIGKLEMFKSRFKLLILKDFSDFKKNLDEDYLEKTYSDFNIPRCKQIIAYKDKDKYFSFFSYRQLLREKTKDVDSLYNYIVNHERAKMKEIKLKVYECQTTEEFFDCLLLEIEEDKAAIKRIKKCKNCQKYFLATGKQIYCDNPSPQNPQKTCRELSDDIKNDNEYYKIYRQYYKKEFARVNRSREFQEESLKLYEEAKNNKIDLVEYKTTMKQLYERLVNGKE